MRFCDDQNRFLFSCRMSSSNRVNGNVPKLRSTSGWKAFDLQQRQNPLVGNEKSKLGPKEDYPMLSETSHIEAHCHYSGKNIERPFSSVVASSKNVSLVDADNGHLNTRESAGESFFGATAHAGGNGKNSVTVEPFQKLQALHPWADESLVKDVLAGVGDNVDEAYALLEAMLGPEYDDKDTKSKEVEPIVLNNASSERAHGVSLIEKENVSITTAKYDGAPSKLLLDILNSLPMEPEAEWDEDDIYLVHRKDAIKMIRSAARHSKAANDAYAKGDGYNAHQLSVKAQEEWDAAEKLNSKAAKEILSLRNSENDVWTLDLHGLHAPEAVQALADRLQSVESISTLNGTHKELERSMKQGPLPRQRPTSLQVITGKGNHSRGAASLPCAIRNFLTDNSYRFDESRPGLITVRPKYRRQ